MTDTREVKNLVLSMLTEETGRAMGDSGDHYGRHWQRNRENPPENLPAVTLDADGCDSYGEASVTVSLAAYLPRVLSLDDDCRAFNALPCADWNGEGYGAGVSKAQAEWLAASGFEAGDEFNSYNGDSFLSQVIQGTAVRKPGEVDEWVLLQIHGGCDVRGGYTVAKLFKVGGPGGDYLDTCPGVIATVTRADGSTVDMDNCHEVIRLENSETGDDVPVMPGDTVTIDLIN